MSEEADRRQWWVLYLVKENGSTWISMRCRLKSVCDSISSSESISLSPFPHTHIQTDINMSHRHNSHSSFSCLKEPLMHSDAEKAGHYCVIIQKETTTYNQSSFPRMCASVPQYLDICPSGLIGVYKTDRKKKKGA